MAASQWKAGRIPFALGDRSARFVALALAAILGGNLALTPGERTARQFLQSHEAQIEAAAREHGIAVEELKSLVTRGISRRTPLQAMAEHVAMEEWLKDPTSHYLVAAAFADIAIGPLQLSPRETMRAIRETGAPWTKEYREIGFRVPHLLPGQMPALSKAEVVQQLFDGEESMKLGALVLASRQARSWR